MEVLEEACRDALEDRKIGYSFKEDVNRAVKAKGLPAINWGTGVWQQVRKVQKDRKDYVHVISALDRSNGYSLPSVDKADEAIKVLREAIRSIYQMVGRGSPPWVEDDNDPGWKGTKGVMVGAVSVKVLRAGVKEDDPDVVKIAYVYQGQEHMSEIEPPGTDHKPLLEDLIKKLQVPASAVRAYRGETLLEEREFTARGSDRTP